MRRNLWVVVSLAALLLASPCAPGAVKNFITDGGTWNTAANWADSITGLPGVPGTNDDASFTASSGSSCVLNSGAALKGLAFTTSGGYALAYSGATQSLSIYGDGITVNPSTPSTITVNPGAAIGLGSATVLANQTWNIAAGSTLNLGTSGQNIFCYSGPTVQVTGGGTVNLLAFVPQDYSAKFQIDNSTLAFNGGTKASIIGGLSGSGTVSIPMAAAGQCVDVWASSDSTWTGAITGTAPFFKTGPGTFTVSGSGNIGLQTYLRGGTLDLDYTGANQTHLAGMTGSTGLTFVGGSLKVDGNASAPTSDSAGFLRVGGNSTYANYTSEISTINVVHGADQTATLTFSNTQAITTYAAQMIRFTGNDLGGTGTGYSRIMFGATGVNSQNGIIGGFASVTDPTGATEADFAKFDATLGVIALPAVGRAGDPNTAPNNSNVLMTVGTTLASVKQMNSLKLSGNIGLNLGGTSLKLVSGGIMQTGADNTTGITNGTIDCSNYGTPY